MPELRSNVEASKQLTRSAGDATYTLAAVEPTVAGNPPAAPQLASPPGYELIGEIDRGGMGVVYHARQVQLNREVALKVVRDADPKSLLRFLAEAEAVASIRHPHVVQVFDSGQYDSRPYLAMELCSGGTLTKRLRDGGKMSPHGVAELLAKVADGVAAAHAAGIVHRDLKPGNVLFDAAGEPKVADFGLAKRGAGADLTNTQTVMGTPAYMCPEQASGAAKFVGPPADVWALGVMLYEALTGAKPFDAPDPMAVMLKVIAAEPSSIRSVSQEVPRELELIAHKCLAKEPGERYPTAAELVTDLRNWLAGRPVSVKPVGTVERAFKWVRRNKVLTGVTTAVVALLATSTAVSIGYAIRAEQALQARDAAVASEKAVARKFLRFLRDNPELRNLDQETVVSRFRLACPDVSREELVAAFRPTERGTASAASFNETMYGD